MEESADLFSIRNYTIEPQKISNYRGIADDQLSYPNSIYESIISMGSCTKTKIV